MPVKVSCGKFCVVTLGKLESARVHTIYSDLISVCTCSCMCVCQYEHTNVISCLIERWYWSLFSLCHPLHWLSITFFLLSAAGNQSSILLFHDFLSPMVRFLPLSWIQYNAKILHPIINSSVDFSPSSSFKSRKRDMEDLQFSMRRQCGHPSCLYRWQNVVLTNSHMYLSFFLFLWIIFTYCAFLFLHENAALWLAERSLPACLWTACVPWACPRRHSFFSFFPRMPLFTLVMSRLLPLSRLRHWNPWREEAQEEA